MARVAAYQRGSLLFGWQPGEILGEAHAVPADDNVHKQAFAGLGYHGVGSSEFAVGGAEEVLPLQRGEKLR